MNAAEKSIELWKNFLAEIYHEAPVADTGCVVCHREWELECVCPDGWTLYMEHFVCDDEQHVMQLRELMQEAYEYSRTVPLEGNPEFFIGSDIVEGLGSFLEVNRGYPEEWDILSWMRNLCGGVRMKEPRSNRIRMTDPAPCLIKW